MSSWCSWMAPSLHKYIPVPFAPLAQQQLSELQGHFRQGAPHLQLTDGLSEPLGAQKCRVHRPTLASHSSCLLLVVSIALLAPDMPSLSLYKPQHLSGHLDPFGIHLKPQTDRPGGCSMSSLYILNCFAADREL